VVDGELGHRERDGVVGVVGMQGERDGRRGDVQITPPHLSPGEQ